MANTVKTSACFVLLSILFSSFVYPQRQTDVQAWPGVSLTLDLPKKWALTFQYRSRLIDNAAYYKGSYLFTTLEYDIHKHIELMANYRLALVDVGTFHRYFLGLAFKTK